MVTPETILKQYARAHPPSDALSQFRRLASVAEYVSSPQANADILRKWFDLFHRKFTISKDDTRRDKSNNVKMASPQGQLWENPTVHRRNPTQPSKPRPAIAMAAEYLLNCLQIAKTARSKGYRDLDREYIALDRELRTKGSWIEDAFLEEAEFKRNTFLLQYNIERSITTASPMTHESIEGRPTIQISRDILENIIERLESGPLRQHRNPQFKNLRGFRRYSLDLPQSKFDELSYIHHEISENAMAHAINSSMNDRATCDLELFFGNLFYAQFGTLEISERTDFIKIKSIHHSLVKYITHMSESSGRSRHAFWTINYCDTGPGILAHVEKFLDKSEQGNLFSSIKHVIDHQVTTRNFPGSGFGLKKIRDFARLVSGLLIVECNGISYSYDSLSGEELELPTVQTRGTMFTIIVPVDRP